MNTLFSSAIDFVKGQTKMAAGLSCALGKKIHQSRVSYWKNKPPEDFPPEYCLPVEKLTGGRIPASALRPDIYPPEMFARSIKETKVTGA
jgi:DNA-binding transcriptional regulator YdaS (Cro superfamily)